MKIGSQRQTSNIEQSHTTNLRTAATKNSEGLRRSHLHSLTAQATDKFASILGPLAGSGSHD
ncbi:MAG: hypothetical protein CBE43_07915 [Rhodopirellula sp. TMED283]|nr:MAG: hypothetical protein CBE43_07915 [Rhodopirellula sp. TMED283]